MGDIVMADPDQLEELADKLWTPGDGGAYGELVSILDRARNLDVSQEMTTLKPLLQWLMDAAIQMRDGARILRGETEYRDPIPGYVPPQGDGDSEAEWEFEVIGQLYADEFVDLASKDELSEEDISRLQGLAALHDTQPEFAGYLIDTLGTEEFLRLSQRVEDVAADMDDASDANSLLDSMGSMLSAAMWVPGDLMPGTDEYQAWIDNTSQGQRYQERLDAFNDAGQQQVGSGEETRLGYEVALDLLELSEVPIDSEFFDQTMTHLTSPLEAAGGHGAPWSQDIPDSLMMLASRTNPEAVDRHLFSIYSTGEAKAEWAENLLNQGNDMTDADVAALSAVMQANQDNEAFAVELATEVGAEGILEAWSGLIDPQYEYEASEDRVASLTRLQDGLGGVLGLATRSDDPRMEDWEDAMVAQGERQFGGEDVEWQPYGFQLMSSLMGSGEYSQEFLTGEGSYGDALLKFEQDMEYPGAQWAEGYSDSRPVVVGENFRIDPVIGFMDALARNPVAATDLFRDPVTMDYLLENRYEEAPGLGSEPSAATSESGGIAVLESTGDALLAATTGVNGKDAPGIMPTQHDEFQVRIFDEFIDFAVDEGNSLPPEFRESTASILGSYREAVYEAAVDPLNPGPRLSSEQLAVIETQVARDPDAYQILSMNMNAKYVQTIANDTTDDPKYRLDDVGRAIGFLEEGRYAALEIDGGDSSWYGSTIYNLGTYGLSKLPVGGDELGLLVDMSASAWSDTQNEAIENGLRETQEEYFSENNAYLRELSRQWRETHPLPPEERADGASDEDWVTDTNQVLAEGALLGSENARQRMENAGIVTSGEG